ncbi:hypothetical protein NKH18_30780 [Streptomyces sp. M10(2022)]
MIRSSRIRPARPAGTARSTRRPPPRFVPESDFQAAAALIAGACPTPATALPGLFPRCLPAPAALEGRTGKAALLSRRADEPLHVRATIDVDSGAVHWLPEPAAPQRIAPCADPRRPPTASPKPSPRAASIPSAAGGWGARCQGPIWTWWPRRPEPFNSRTSGPGWPAPCRQPRTSAR